jgi:hypothetical protein
MPQLLDLKLKIDHRIIEIVNLWRQKSFLELNHTQRKALAICAEKFNSKAKKEKIIICGNGPSLNEINFSDFASIDSLVVNYFYKHPKASSLKPNYYVIIDRKIVSGIWPIKMINEIFDQIPTTELFLDVRWLNLEVMRPYINHSRINWILPNILPNFYLKPKIDIKNSICGLNVVAAAVSISTCIGYKELGFAGVDGDGLFREILDRPSHFYSGDKDVSMKTYTSMVKSLFLSAETLWAWQGIVGTHAKSGINLTNLCKGGIMDCMPRKLPSDFI